MSLTLLIIWYHTPPYPPTHPPSITHLTSNIPDVHIPVQAYNGKNGKFNFSANFTRVATNANTGPVLPMIVIGCADVNAYITPHAAVLDTWINNGGGGARQRTGGGGGGGGGGEERK
jgi:hypothetical protein